MSTGFKTSYGDILKYDLRHIYSGTPPPELTFRREIYGTRIDPLDRVKEQLYRSKTTFLPARYFEYVPEYNAVIRKPMGFQRLSKHDVDDVVTRLTSSGKTTPRRQARADNKQTESPSRDRKTNEKLDVNEKTDDSDKKSNDDGKDTHTKTTNNKVQQKDKRRLTDSEVEKLVERVYTNAVAKQRPCNRRQKVVVPKSPVPRSNTPENMNVHLDAD